MHCTFHLHCHFAAALWFPCKVSLFLRHQQHCSTCCCHSPLRVHRKQEFSFRYMHSFEWPEQCIFHTSNTYSTKLLFPKSYVVHCSPSFPQPFSSCPFQKDTHRALRYLQIANDQWKLLCKTNPGSHDATGILFAHKSFPGILFQPELSYQYKGGEFELACKVFKCAFTHPSGWVLFSKVTWCIWEPNQTVCLLDVCSHTI